jgi:hypothetical protein
MNTLTDAVGRVAESARSLVELEVQAALSEMRKKAATLGIGAGLMFIALLLLGLSITFGLAAATAELANYMTVVEALLVMCSGVLVFALLFASVGIAALRRGSTPPELFVSDDVDVISVDAAETED